MRVLLKHVCSNQTTSTPPGTTTEGSVSCASSLKRSCLASPLDSFSRRYARDISCFSAMESEERCLLAAATCDSRKSLGKPSQRNRGRHVSKIWKDHELFCIKLFDAAGEEQVLVECVECSAEASCVVGEQFLISSLVGAVAGSALDGGPPNSGCIMTFLFPAFDFVPYLKLAAKQTTRPLLDTKCSFLTQTHLSPCNTQTQLPLCGQLPTRKHDNLLTLCAAPIKYEIRHPTEPLVALPYRRAIEHRVSLSR